MFNWSGNKASFKGDIPFYGKSGLDFYTTKKVGSAINGWVCTENPCVRPQLLSGQLPRRAESLSPKLPLCLKLNKRQADQVYAMRIRVVLVEELLLACIRTPLRWLRPHFDLA